MTRLPEIWKCIQDQLPRNQWVPLEKIYSLIENSLSLDEEDIEPQSPSSDIPKWKRNVRNVLPHRKKSGEIRWNGEGSYKI